MSKKTKTVAPYTGPLYPLDSMVKILRPNLWSGTTGTVVQFSNDGRHRVHVTAKDGVTYPSGFHAEALGTELQLLTADDLLA